MVGDSSLLESSGDVAAATGVHEGSEVGMVGSNSGEEDKGRLDEGERGFTGNRWPRQETLALLKIRSDMDAAFRDSSLKGPLWEEVSKKLAELGYSRSAKKCKEKFENVYKYHKRTKDGRTGKQDGKTYRFFDQLEALENLHSLPSPSKPQALTPTAAPLPWNNAPPAAPLFGVPPIANPKSIVPQNNVVPVANPMISTPPAPSINAYPITTVPCSLPNISSNLFSSSTSSSTASDEEFEGRGRRKRKWKEFFKRLTREVILKQEELQKRFLETIEKREHERTVREEAWRIQEMARINREHEILVQERSTAAAKDAAVIAFLQKISGQQQQTPIQTHETPPPPPPPATLPQQQQQQQPLARPQPLPPAPVTMTKLHTPKMDNEDNFVASSPSRWPKGEVLALIQLRTNLDLKYEENGPKGPLWEEISAGMRKLGYNRSAKRCKEKWENINKYFKKVKESNKKRPEDSKTCPYFQQLEALYREKNKNDSFLASGCPMTLDINPVVPLVVHPEQQWPIRQENQQQQTQPQQQAVMEDIERDNVDQIHDEEEDEGTEEEEEDDDDDDAEGGGFEIVANKAASMDTGERDKIESF